MKLEIEWKVNKILAWVLTMQSSVQQKINPIKGDVSDSELNAGGEGAIFVALRKSMKKRR